MTTTLYIKSEETFTPASDSIVLDAAHSILESQALNTDIISNPELCQRLLKTRIGHLEREVFVMMSLTNRHQIIDIEILFQGTINAASVYPREVAKAALYSNAAAVVFSHNHPSGLPEPSQADINLTKRLVETLDLIEVRVLDHIIIGGNQSVSFAERGLI